MGQASPFWAHDSLKAKQVGKRHSTAKAIINRCDNEVSAVEISAHRNLHSNRDPSSSFVAAVTSKIEDGNLRAAIRMLSLNEQLAPCCEDTVSKLLSKHPEAPHDRHPFPAPSLFAPLQVTDEIVREVITSFPAGSAWGPDNFRPRHMLDL